MKSLLWKELRENAPWCFWGMGLCALSLALGLWVLHSGAIGSLEYASSISSETILLILVWVGVVLGLGLGFHQSLPETRPDQWAFLIHRPISRTAIFLGKITAGLSLYLLAIGLPFLAATIWAATPGNIAAPFYWGMTLPGLIHLFDGTLFYLAGFLAGIRQTKWYGSRLLGVGAAIFITSRIGEVKSAWEAVAWILLGAMALFLAARAAFIGQNSGSHSSTSLKFPLIAVNLLGLIFLYDLGLAFLPAKTSQPTLRQQYLLLRDGRLLQVTSEGNSITQVTDPQGKTFSGSKEFSFSGFLPKISLEYNPRLSSPDYRQVDAFFHCLANGEDSSTFVWYYSSRDNLFLGYSKATNLLQKIGTPQGFQNSDEPVLTHFSPMVDLGNNGEILQIFRTQREVYRVDFDQQKIQELYHCPDRSSLLAASFLKMDRDRNLTPENQVIAIGTEIGVNFYRRDGSPLLTIPYARDLSQYGVVHLSYADQAQIVCLWQDPSHEQEKSQSSGQTSFLSAYKLNGTLVAQYELPKLSSRPPRDHWSSQLAAFVSPFGQGTQFLFDTFYADLQSRSAQPILWRHLDEGIEKKLSSLLSSLLGSGFFALIYYFFSEQWRMNNSSRLFWSFAIFWFGLPAWGAFYFAQDCPKKIRCPACTKDREINRQCCEHCGHDWPSPSTDGTEIFSASVI